jgi:salicylate hydroxylase
MGDAVHATTPWQGLGAGMAIEDSLMLSTLLGLSQTPSEAVTALRIYDQVRRPRTQHIIESSRVTGDIMTGKGLETGLELAKLKEKLLPRWEFIIDFDVGNHIKQAREIFAKELANESH